MAKKAVTVSEIKHRDYKRAGRTIAGEVVNGAKADIIPGESIRIYGERYPGPNPQAFDKTFKIGDAAEHGGYNLTYVGKIISITPNSVTIRDDLMNRTKRLTLAEFVSKNWDFDAERIAKRNAEALYSI